MGDPEAENTHIPGPGDVDQVRPEGMQLADHMVPVAVKQRIATQIVPQRKRCWATLQLQGLKASRSFGLCLIATINTTEWKILPLSMLGVFLA